MLIEATRSFPAITSVWTVSPSAMAPLSIAQSLPYKERRLLNE
jgi:hypothetical protein